jgi:transcriptional regulator with XRE-family HTH domain
MGSSPRDDDTYEPFDAPVQDRPAQPFETWLAAELNDREMTPGRLARLTGLHRSTISRLLHGERKPTVETAARIALAIGSTLPQAGVERRRDIVARVRYELDADPTMRPRDVQRVMTHYVRQRAAARASFRA